MAELGAPAPSTASSIQEAVAWFHSAAAREWSGGVAAPLPPNETDRLRALRDYSVLDTPPEERFDRLTRLAARSLRVATALVTLVDQDRQFLKSCFGLEGITQTPRSAAFCAYTILQDEAFVVPDATQDPRFANNPLVTGWPHSRFYAGVPLVSPSGHHLGSLCAIDTVPRTPSPDDLLTLRELAALVVDELELRRALRESEAQRTCLEVAEARYRDLAESIQGMAFQAVQRGAQHFEYEYVSIGSLELFGLLPEQIVGDRQHLRRLVHPDDLEGMYGAIAGALRERSPYHWEGRFLVNGEEKWIRILARGEVCDDGPTVWRGVMVDVTEARLRERALAEARERADRATRAKGDFLSRMSHELRTPLNAILGFAQTLAMEELATEAREDVAEIGRAGRHLLGLINEVLDLAAGETQNTPPVATEVVFACDVLNEIYGLLRPLLDERGVRLRAVHRCDDAEVLADRGRLKQAILNVMTNAIKYNREGGSVRVRTRVEAGLLAIAISDEGPGIPPESLGRLFTPFDRLGAERTGAEGTGLGLAITQGLIEAMGGAIHVESEVGRGTTFTLRLLRAGETRVAA